ncbi:MAG: phosphatase PAP2 family protein [Candidatus Marinimicrobia bacterium]|nr:phosphatase PAP2 family protein [Candidatus Neomarinimicrobiota bacterium]
MLVLFLSTFLFSYIYSLAGMWLSPNPMDLMSYLIFTIVLAVVIVGGYQIFFWVQNNNYFFPTRCFKIALDDKIPFWPLWIWPYSLLYYVMIGLIVARVSSLEEGIYLIFGGLLILIFQSIFFMLLPATVPPEYRRYEVNSRSRRFLKYIQGLDNGRNCFPSMHCSIATYVGLLLIPVIGIYSYVFIAIICVSCLFVKQHQIIDIIPGVLLGALTFYITPNIII